MELLREDMKIPSFEDYLGLLNCNREAVTLEAVGGID